MEGKRGGPSHDVGKRLSVRRFGYLSAFCFKSLGLDQSRSQVGTSAASGAAHLQTRGVAAVASFLGLRGTEFADSAARSDDSAGRNSAADFAG